MKHFRFIPFLAAATAAALFLHCGPSEQQKMTDDFSRFVTEFDSVLIPLSREANLSYFQATISGADADYTRAADLEIQRTKLFADKERFAKLKAWKESGAIQEPLLARQLQVLFNAFLANQIDEKKLEEMINLQSATEKKFSNFRAEVAGKKLTDNQIEDILKTSRNSAELESVWLASKTIGGVVSADVLRLVHMRNDAAKELGFPNYHSMRLALSEQNPQEIETLFDELDSLTRGAFASVKGELDSVLAAGLGIPVSALMPWHYQNRFFQEAPKVYGVDLDALYKDKDVVALTKQFYAGIGLPIDEILTRSDLYEKEGKYQHAYCTDIDRQGDVRVVCNVTPSYNWMNTMLHECGHAVYDRHKDYNVPWLLREPAHTFTTEAIAMIFGRFASHPAWLREVAGIPQDVVEKVADGSVRTLRLEQLVFSRWAQVMYRFERAMYENPDRDLNTLWWDLVERYQMIKRPAGRNAPDWASKIHVALYPAYYHNYLLGELLASQLYFTIGGTVLKARDISTQSFANRPEIGEFLRKNIFDVGNTLFWNDMIEKATGEKLTAKYYARQFVE